MSTQLEIASKGHSLTPKTFKYVLSSTDYGVKTLQYVPEGWDGSELTFIRDPQYKGVLTQFSTSDLKFVKDGRDYIQEAYEAKGIDYDITITIYMQNNSTFQDEVYFTGKIDLSTYSIDSIGVSCKILPTGFQNTVLNRDNIKVDLFNTKFIGGGDGSMPQISGMPELLTLTNYSAQANADWLISGTKAVTDAIFRAYIPMTINGTEFESGETFNQQYIKTILSTEKFFKAANPYSSRITATINVRINSTLSSQFGIEIQILKNGIPIYTDNDSGTGTIVNVTFNINTTEDLVLDDELSVIVLVSEITVTDSDYSVDFFSSDLNIDIELGEELDAVSVESFPIFEFTARTIQLISGIADPLDSIRLGRTDSLPTAYGSDGELSKILMTNGLLIRGFAQSELTFNGSLQDIFKTLNAIGNIGLGFENNKVKIEEEKYFFDIEDNPSYPGESQKYQTNQILDFSSVLTSEVIKKDVLPDWYANEIKVGFSDFEYENIQGLKEFNTKSSYATPIKSVKRTLDLVSSDRGDTQGTNKLRAKPFSTDPTEDVNGDNDIFLFDAKRDAPWTVKTDEDFDLVTGGIDPAQSYNLNYTPRRNLERHGNRIRSMQLALGDEIQWMQSEKNNKLVTQKTGETTTKAENADIVVSELDVGYWIPEAYIFTAPVNGATIAAIKANPYGVIKVDTDKYGWILEVQSNNEDNKGEFKLLRVDLDNVKIIIPPIDVKYGWLYNWYAATDVREITSEGWSLLTLTEAFTLFTSLGGSSVAGGKIKVTGTELWIPPNNATNDSGISFSGPGHRLADGTFSELGENTRIGINFESGGLWNGIALTSAGVLTNVGGYSGEGLAQGLPLMFIKDDSEWSEGDTYTGNDGSSYNTVKIGSQVLTVGPIAETKYRTGVLIQTVTGNTEWSGLITGAKCAYDNDESNVLI